MDLKDLDEGAVYDYAEEEIMDRGDAYLRRGAVASLVLRDGILHAEVEGSYPYPFRVTIRRDAKGHFAATCSCPYEWGGWCKHAVAVFLAAARFPEAVEQRPALSDLLTPLDRDALLSLLAHLAEKVPDLEDEITTWVGLQSARKAKGATVTAGADAKPVIDPGPIKRRMRGILRQMDSMSGSEAYWHTGGIVSEAGGLLNEVKELIEAGDGRNAIAALQAITEEYVSEWTEYDDSDGELGGFFEQLGESWTEAVLSAELTPAEQTTWARRLDAWQNEVADYGIDDAFAPAAEAVRQGWSYPPLVRAMRGDITEEGAWEGEAPFYADELAVARLNVLERQGRFEEALNLARAEGQDLRAALLLLRLGRLAEAERAGVDSLSTPDEALTMARALQESDATEAALRVGERGLEMDVVTTSFYPAGEKASLASWLRDAALAAERTDLAVRAAEVGLRERPDLQGWRTLQDIAVERWPALREDLLRHYRERKPYPAAGLVDIFLVESQPDDALDAAEQGYGSELLARTVDAVLPVLPERVLPICRTQADAIMNGGKSAHYQEAFEWLKRAKAASESLDRTDEWEDYLRGLKETHRRRYKLMPLLERL